MQKSLMVLNGSGFGASGKCDDNHGEVASIDEIRADCAALCDQLNIVLDFRHSGDADELARWIVEDGDSFDGLIVDPGGRSGATDRLPTTYGAALRTFADRNKPIVEVHLANFHRQMADISKLPREVEAERGFVCGFGKRGYAIAIRAIARKLAGQASS